MRAICTGRHTGSVPRTRPQFAIPERDLVLDLHEQAQSAGVEEGRRTQVDDDIGARTAERTSRHPFAEKDVPEDVQATLQGAAEREGAVLLFAGPWHAETVLDLIRDAESRDTLDPDASEDLVRWTRLGPEADTAVDGVPEYAFGPRKRDGKAPVRDFAGRRRVADRGTTTFEHTPHLALRTRTAHPMPTTSTPLPAHLQGDGGLGAGPHPTRAPRVRGFLRLAGRLRRAVHRAPRQPCPGHRPV